MNQNNANGGIGFIGLLTIVLITLKLAGIGSVADWSWWWVLSPLWIAALAVVAVIVGATIFIIARDHRRKARR